MANTTIANMMILGLRVIANADLFLSKDRNDMNSNGHEARPISITPSRILPQPCDDNEAAARAPSVAANVPSLG